MSIQERSVSERVAPRERLPSAPPATAEFPAWVFADRTELANTITHGLGFAVSLIAAWYLIGVAAQTADAWRIAACTIYAVSLAAVYAASTLSHLFHQPGLRRFFRKLDQGLIYFLIAGTFTPFGLVFLRGGWWIAILAVMWGVALWAFFVKLAYGHRLEQVSISACLILGWLPVASTPPLSGMLPANCFWIMMAGGLAYSIGTVFLLCDARHWFFHATWHLFVIAGSALHYWAILHYVARA